MKKITNCSVAEVRDLEITWVLDISCWILDIVNRPYKGSRFLCNVLVMAMIGVMFLSISAMAGVIDPTRSKALIKVLQSDAAFYDKARACQQAGEFGTAELVPVLASLLGNEKLSAYARSGLENIPDPSAAAALRDALGTLKGDMLRGVVNSLGVLRDKKSVDALQKLAADFNSGVNKEALLALGRIANTDCIKTLRTALKSASVEMRPHAAAGCLLAAQRQLELGKTDAAKILYDELRVMDLPAPYRIGATYGAIVSRKAEGTGFLIEQLISVDENVRKEARLAAQDYPEREVAGAICTALNPAAPEKRSLLQETLQCLYYKPLIKGKRFQGWEGDTDKSFRMKSGAIVGGNLKEKIPRNEFLATTRHYTNFILRADCKLVGPVNAGIQIRSQRIPNHHEMIGYQADMSVGKEGGYWGKLYDESRRKKILGKKINHAEMMKNLKPGDWNHYEIRCEGRRIQLFLNGVRTLDYTEKDKSIQQSGVIAVQIHGGPPGEAWYRNVQIVELP